MSELVSAIQCGEPCEIEAIVSRLKDLPEFGMGDDLKIIAEKVKQVELAQDALSAARFSLRGAAMKLIRKAASQWTPAEIANATGYRS